MEICSKDSSILLDNCQTIIIGKERIIQFVFQKQLRFASTFSTIKSKLLLGRQVNPFRNQVGFYFSHLFTMQILLCNFCFLSGNGCILFLVKFYIYSVDLFGIKQEKHLSCYVYWILRKSKKKYEKIDSAHPSLKHLQIMKGKCFLQNVSCQT